MFQSMQMPRDIGPFHIIGIGGIGMSAIAEILAELMRLYSTISVTGTHGKTTTTSLLSHIFAEAGEEPTVITGGIINSWGSNARLGQGKWMIVRPFWRAAINSGLNGFTAVEITT
jgi:UDP-N-acetylmuramate-alanine ligase